MNAVFRVLGIAAVALVFLAAPEAEAQMRYNYFSVGVHVGTAHYQGDLDDDGFEFWKGNGNPFSNNLLRPSFGAHINYHFSKHIIARLKVTHGWIGAADSLASSDGRVARNLHFRSPLTEASVQLMYEFFATSRFYTYRPKWTPYIFTGLSVFRFNPKAQPNEGWVEDYPEIFGDDPDQWVELKPLGTEGQNLPDALRNLNDLPDPYALTQISIPIGVGVRYTIANRWDLRVEVGLRNTFTDYLDDVGGPNYAPPDLLLAYEGEKSFLFADRSAAANFGVNRRGARPTQTEPGVILGAYGQDGNFRGQDNQKDWYGFIHLGISYIIDHGDMCPKHK